MPAVIVKDSAGQSEVEANYARIIGQCREKADRARRTRGEQNKANWDLYHGRQDFSYKQKYQSKEFLPDLPIAVEQMAGVIERALTDFADWFDIKPSYGGYDDPVQRLLVDPISMVRLLTYVLGRLWQPGNQADTAYGFPTLIADAVKLGLMEAVITLKIYGVDAEEPRFRLERGEREVTRDLGNGYELVYRVPMQVVGRVLARTFRVAIETIPWEDFFPDPSGLNLYDIHEVTRGLNELADNDDYDPEVLLELQAQTLKDAEAEFEKRRRSGEDDTGGIDDLLKVRVREFWGDLVDPVTGRTLERNTLITSVGDTALLRPPTPNPFWHGKRPFVKSPLIRVPHSTVHKALIDHAGPMAKVMNEVMNLMLDGGLQATWGTRQVRPDMLENPDEISDGIPQAYTAVLKPNQPADAKFLERVDSGELPEYTMAVFGRVERSFQMGMATNDIKMAQLPPRQVKATEIVESNAAAGSLFESIVARLEDGLIAPTLELVWGLIWQHMDDFAAPELVEILGPRRALLLLRMSPEERFVRMAQAAKFKVGGLRAILGAAREYQKYMAFGQLLMTNPAFAKAFDLKYSTVKLLSRVMKSIQIDPASLEKDEGAGPELDASLLTGPQGGSQPAPPGAPGIEGEMAPTNPTGDRGSQA